MVFAERWSGENARALSNNCETQYLQSRRIKIETGKEVNMLAA
ncbi:MAG: hypothetical protein QG592_1829 [Pseudomonadota bacterium]|nr:hypothetical protein [Pseudomonadota bacterium]